MSTIKTILISKIPLPYHKIGSWSTMYGHYLQTNNHQIDYIICPLPKKKHKNITYYDSNLSLSQKITYKLLKKNKNAHILKIVAQLIKPSEKYIIQFIDEFGTIDYIAEKLNEKYGKQTFYYQFFYHGFAPYYDNFASRKFYNLVDEMVLLTHKSYAIHKEYYTVLPCKFSVLHNGIDSHKFKQISAEDKKELRKKNKVETSKLIFLWLSQDRPKKGLDFILNIWNEIETDLKEKSELWIIGSEREFKQQNVKSFGRIQNSEIDTYYKMADVYLFPTLWQEGFGLSLIEALKCGCHCVASDIGGVPEVLQNGKLGTLIKEPHFSENWKVEIENLMNQNSIPKTIITEKTYSIDVWSLQMNNLISKAAQILANKS